MDCKRVSQSLEQYVRNRFNPIWKVSGIPFHLRRDGSADNGFPTLLTHRNSCHVQSNIPFVNVQLMLCDNGIRYGGTEMSVLDRTFSRVYSIEKI